MSEIEQEDLDFADADALVKEMSDKLIITPPPTREAMDKFMEEQEEKALKAGEHDCWELVTHGHYKRDNGGYNDYYECSVCGYLLQVG